MGGPEFTPSSSKPSSFSRALRSRSSLTSARMYSLTLLYSPEVTRRSTYSFIGSGMETFMVFMRPSIRLMAFYVNFCQGSLAQGRL